MLKYAKIMIISATIFAISLIPASISLKCKLESKEHEIPKNHWDYLHQRKIKAEVNGNFRNAGRNSKCNDSRHGEKDNSKTEIQHDNERSSRNKTLMYIALQQLKLELGRTKILSEWAETDRGYKIHRKESLQRFGCRTEHLLWLGEQQKRKALISGYCRTFPRYQGSIVGKERGGQRRKNRGIARKIERKEIIDYYKNMSQAAKFLKDHNSTALPNKGRPWRNAGIGTWHLCLENFDYCRRSAGREKKTLWTIQ